MIAADVRSRLSSGNVQGRGAIIQRQMSGWDNCPGFPFEVLLYNVLVGVVDSRQRSRDKDGGQIV